jgi:MOSC domain
MIYMRHLTSEELEAGLDNIRYSPKDQGVLEMIVRRPKDNEREMLVDAELDLDLGLVGDNWRTRGSSRMPDKSAHPEMQINIMNSRVIALIAQQKERWSLAGDQLYIDFDISVENLPAGTRLAIGSAVIEVTPQPHTGCRKFLARFGEDAMKFVNSQVGKELRLRGMNAKVIQAGTIHVQDVVKKV